MKTRILLICIGMSTMAAFSMDIFLPSLPAIKDQFGLSESHLQLSISLYLWSYALFQLFAGSLSDRFGRTKTFGIGCLIYSAAALGCGVAATFNQLLLYRAFQGFGACVGPVTALAITRDLLERKERAYALSFISSAVALAPIMAPMIGSFLETYFDWRANFYFLAAYGIALLSMLHFLPETLTEKSSLHWKEILKGYAQVIKNKSWRYYSLISAFCFSALFTWIAASSLYLMNRLGLSEFEFSICFGISAFFFMMAAFSNSRLLKHFKLEHLMAFGCSLCIFGASLMFILAWTTPLSVFRLWGPTIFLSAGIGFVMPNANSVALEAFKVHAGKASAMMNFLRLGIAGLSVSLSSRFYDARGQGISGFMLFFAIVQIVLIGVLLKTHKQI